MYIVTGANGFIGSALTWELNKKGLTDLVLVDSVSPESRPELLSRLRFKEFVDSQEFLKDLSNNRWPGVKAILHMGACSSTTETDIEFLKRNNTEYSMHLFNYCQANQVPYIYASSGAVYGGGELGFDDSTRPENFSPLNPYGWSKLNFDVWALKESLKSAPPLWAGLRFFNVYGPNEYHKGDMSSVAYKAVQQIQQTGQLKLFRSHHPDYRDGEQLRDFVYVKDITRWCLEILDRPQFKSGIYNMGFGQARTWLDLAQAVFKNLNQPLKIDWIDIPENIRNQYQYYTEAKMDRLMAQKLSRPQWSIEDGVKDYVKNYLLESDPYLRGE